MNKLFSFLALLIIVASSALAQDITGKWYGRADAGAMKLRIEFNIRQDAGSYSGVMISPDQSSAELPFNSVRFEKDTLALTIDPIRFTYKGVLKADNTIEGNFTQMGATFKLDLSRQEITVNRPQEPTRPFPYKEESVTFRNDKAGINLGGTLTLPQGTGKHPTVILVSGSGAQNRDEELMAHKPFLVLSDYLTRRGIAVLRYDDRGVGESQGEYSTATVQDFAADASAALAYLKTREEIDPTKTGMIGHSEGGMIAFILAARGEPAFIVSMAGAGISGKELLNLQREALGKQSGLSDEYIKQSNQQSTEAMELAVQLNDIDKLEKEIASRFPLLAPQAKAVARQLASPEIISIFQFNPDDYYKDIKCPVLALNGDKDVQVIADPNLDNIRHQLTDHGNKQVTVKKYPGLNHLFQTSTTGMPGEYGQIEETISLVVLGDICDWILKVTK